MQLDDQARLDISRWADEYITGIVANHDGSHDDVRSIIHDLHDAASVGAPGRLAVTPLAGPAGGAS